MKTFLHQHFWKIVSVIIVVLGIGTFLNFNAAPQLPQESAQESPSQRVETLTFGEWTPQGRRSVLANIESDAEVNLVAELSGTIDRVWVGVGDRVDQGQKLITFRTTLDQTAVNYQNAVAMLESTRLNNQANIAAAQVAVQNAEADLEQTRRQEAASFQKILETLRTRTRNTESSFLQALNLMDQWLGVSNQYRFSDDAARRAIGGRDTINRTRNYNQVQELLRNKEALPLAPSSNDTISMTTYAESRLNFTRSLQEAFALFERLVRGAVLGQNFTQTQLDALLAQVTTIRNAINADLLNLNSALEDLRNTEEQKELAILAAQNRLRNAQTSFESTKANAENQLTTMQNQVRTAQVAQNDLVLRAPFSGVISEKSVNAGAQVSLGQSLLQLTNPNDSKKVVAFLTTNEYERILKTPLLKGEVSQNDPGGLQIVFADQTFEVETRGINARLDPASQKMRVEFTLPQEEQGEVLVGQIGKILLPFARNSQPVSVLPLSSISFEPDGPEVLVVNDDNITERRKIGVGRLKSNAIEVFSGLDEGDLVITYRNRSYAGQKVTTNNQN